MLPVRYIRKVSTRGDIACAPQPEVAVYGPAPGGSLQRQPATSEMKWTVTHARRARILLRGRLPPNPGKIPPRSPQGGMGSSRTGRPLARRSRGRRALHRVARLHGLAPPATPPSPAGSCRRGPPAPAPRGGATTRPHPSVRSSAAPASRRRPFRPRGNGSRIRARLIRGGLGATAGADGGYSPRSARPRLRPRTRRSA